MKTIIVDDEEVMLRRFMRMSAGIPGLDVVAQCQSMGEAILYAKQNKIELAILDVCLPKGSGIALAAELKKLHPDLRIVFISAFDEYVGLSNEIGADYYITKPYRRETLERLMDNMHLLVYGRPKEKRKIYIQMFGHFNVLKEEEPIPLVGKPKEILALVAAKAGKEISNRELYRTIWDGREGERHEDMSVYYNAVSRLKRNLAEASLENLLIQPLGGLMLNVAICDGDFISWKNSGESFPKKFEGEFMPEYTWAEGYLADIVAAQKSL